MNIILGITGSVAAILAPKLIEELSKKGNLKIVLTESARHFVGADIIKMDNCHVDYDEWIWKNKGDDILHIELRKWADIFVIAPLSANTLAKISYGLCDNLLTSVVRAWDWRKPILLAPAMNSYMWSSPITRNQTSIITGYGARIIQPVNKVLACGDQGIGAMADVEEICRFI